MNCLESSRIGAKLAQELSLLESKLTIALASTSNSTSTSTSISTSFFFLLILFKWEDGFEFRSYLLKMSRDVC